jgi:hypothetical protein
MWFNFCAVQVLGTPDYRHEIINLAKRIRYLNTKLFELIRV